jgi:hypothetical protein
MASRSLRGRVLAALFLPSLAFAGSTVTCGGTASSTGAGDGGLDVDAPGEASDDGGDDGDDSVDVTAGCGPATVYSPSLNVTDQKTGAPICDAVLVGDADDGLFPCQDPTNCMGTCPYTATDFAATGGATFSITIQAPGHAPSTVTGLMMLTCGCDAGDCTQSQQNQATLTPLPDSGTTHDGGSSPCPTAEPHTNQACTDASLYCEYGTDPNPYCNALWECVGSTWENKASTEVCPPPSTTCPDYSEIQGGSPCDVELQVCQYSEATCVCTDAPQGVAVDAGSVWSCTPIGAGCPAPRPDIGTACDPSGPKDCDYGACNGNVALECSGGYWAIETVTCPG